MPSRQISAAHVKFDLTYGTRYTRALQATLFLLDRLHSMELERAMRHRSLARRFVLAAMFGITSPPAWLPPQV